MSKINKKDQEKLDKNIEIFLSNDPSVIEDEIRKEEYIGELKNLQKNHKKSSDIISFYANKMNDKEWYSCENTVMLCCNREDWI